MEFIVTQTPKRFTNLEEAQKFAASICADTCGDYFIIPATSTVAGFKVKYVGVLILGEEEE